MRRLIESAFNDVILALYADDGSRGDDAGEAGDTDAGNRERDHGARSAP